MQNPNTSGLVGDLWLQSITGTILWINRKSASPSLEMALRLGLLKYQFHIPHPSGLKTYHFLGGWSLKTYVEGCIIMLQGRHFEVWQTPMLELGLSQASSPNPAENGTAISKKKSLAPSKASYHLISRDHSNEELLSMHLECTSCWSLELLKQPPLSFKLPLLDPSSECFISLGLL